MTDEIFGPAIHTYSRAEALDDGVLVDVSGTARAAGIRFPVALTRTVWDAYVEPQGIAGQDVAGRLWDVLWMLRFAIRSGAAGRDRLLFTVRVRMRGRPLYRRVTLKALCGPGDDVEPVITVMLPDED